MQKRTGRGEWIYGRRPVGEVFAAGRRQVYELAMAAEDRESIEQTQFHECATKAGAFFRQVTKRELDTISGDGNHQGVAVRVSAFPYISIDEVCAEVRENERVLILILDHLVDPQNLGSLMRTADAAGVQAVIIPENRAAAITPAVVRASAGAAEHMRVAKVVNLVRSLNDLKEAGLWVVGLATGGEGVRNYTEIDFKGRIGIAVGSEGHGLKRLTRETCDFVARLPMKGAVASLNASIAGAICMYEAVRQRNA